MKLKLFILVLTISSSIYAQEERVEKTLINLDNISLKGMDRNVKKAFNQTKDIIISARKENDIKTQFEAGSQWCMMLQNYDFLQQAKECYLIIGNEDKENPQWPYLFALSSNKQGEIEDSKIGFKETLRRNINYLPAHFHRIDLDIQQGDLKSAFLTADQVPVEFKLSSPILKLMGDLYYEVENYHVSIGYYKQALDANPMAKSLNYKIGQAYLKLSKEDQAETYISESNSTGVTVVDPYLMIVKNQTVGEVPFLIKAKKALQNKDYSSAINNYKKALEYNPESESGWVNLAVSYYQNQQIEMAKSGFRKALSINPNQKTALFNMANLAFTEGRQLEAMDLFQRLNQLTPNDVQATSKLIALYSANQQHQKIIKLLEAKENIGLDQFFFQKATSYTALGQFESAILVLEQILQNQPNSIEALIALAKIHSQAPDKTIRNAKKSLEYAEKAFGLHKNTKSYWQYIHALDQSKKCKKLGQLMEEFAGLVNVNQKEVEEELQKQRADQLNCD